MTFWLSCSSEPRSGNFSVIRKRFIFCEAAGSRWATATKSAPLGTLFKTASGAPRSKKYAAEAPITPRISTAAPASNATVAARERRSLVGAGATGCIASGAGGGGTDAGGSW